MTFRDITVIGKLLKEQTFKMIDSFVKNKVNMIKYSIVGCNIPTEYYGFK